MYGKKLTEKCVLNKNIKLQGYKNYFKPCKLKTLWIKNRNKKTKKLLKEKYSEITTNIYVFFWTL